MSQFVFKNEALEHYISTLIDNFKKIITDEVGYESLLLSGDFAKGEGAIQIDDGKPLLIDRIHFIIVGEKIEPRLLLELEKQCAESIGKIPQTHLEHFDAPYSFDQFLDIRISSCSLEEVSLLKEYFVVLAGKELVCTFHLVPQDAIDLLTSALVDLLLCIKTTHLIQKIISKEESDVIKYYVSKTYLRIASALLVLEKNPQPTYIKIVEVFRQWYGSQPHELQHQIPDLIEKVERSTLYKLRPEPTRFDALKVLEACLDDVETIYRYILNSLLGTSLTNNWYDNYSLFEKPFLQFYKDSQAKAFHKIFKKKNPRVKLIMLSPFVLFSLHEDGSSDKKTVDLIFDVLRTISTEPTPDKSWEGLKRHYLNIYRTYFLH